MTAYVWAIVLMVTLLWGVLGLGLVVFLPRMPRSKTLGWLVIVAGGPVFWVMAAIDAVQYIGEGKP